MCMLTLNLDPLNCTCWLLLNGEYCTYCEVVCDAALQDHECGVGDWLTLGAQSAFKQAQEVVHQATLAEFFEDGWAPTPPPINYMEDLREELPIARSWLSREKKGMGEENQCPHILARVGCSVGKPYARVDGNRKEDLALYLVSLQ
ncbi:hypothetical protein FRC08_002081 [Ceratobasidium sp. 394]|nr:hypothetical protein FRC08_002081 [Ceratobasidium sp. 394]